MQGLKVQREYGATHWGGRLVTNQCIGKASFGGDEVK